MCALSEYIPYFDVARHREIKKKKKEERKKKRIWNTERFFRRGIRENFEAFLTVEKFVHRGVDILIGGTLEENETRAVSV